MLFGIRPEMWEPAYVRAALEQQAASTAGCNGPITGVERMVQTLQGLRLDARRERLTGVKIDAENARHLFADWEQTVFLAAAQLHAGRGRSCGGGLLVELTSA